ncbi:MAG: hypothetical protein AAFO29_10315 [Actinomycetota bacterium]
MPCQVALVVGCVTTVDGEDGPVPLTLRVAGEDGQADTANPASTGTLGSVAVGSTDDAALNPDEEPPVRSGVDPWERGGLRSNFGTASIPISHYQIGADTSGFMGVPDPLDSFVASQTNWAFTTSAFLVLLSTNTLDWAFEFPLANDLVGRAGLLAQDYTIDFFGFGLSTSIYALALSITMVVAGFKAVTKGLIAAGSDVLLAFIAYVILVVLTMTSGFGDAGLQVARLSSDLSGSIASFASGQQRQEECAAALAADREAPSVAGATASTDGGDGAAPAAANSAACSFGFALQRSLVELPYQNLQWGQVLDGVEGKERCAQINQELLAEGAWGNSDEPRQRMSAVDECRENAEFNSQATYIRLGIASANALAAAIATLLVLVVAAMLLWQQLKLLFLTAVLPHTLVFAILPGRSRALAWRWLEQLVGVVIRTVILALGLVVWLSLFSLIVYEQLTFRGIFLSLFASTAMSVAGFYGLYKLSGLTGRANPIGPGRIRGGGDEGSGGGPGSAGDRSDDDRPRRDGGTSTGTRTVTRAAASGMRTVRTRRAEPVGAGVGGRSDTGPGSGADRP